MWHEARKQERKIRGMLVDYRKRAERRQDFYEKIKADPTQFIQIHGRKCRIHLDPAVAVAGDSPAIMMPWQGQIDNMIDRFDGRAYLDIDRIPQAPKLKDPEEEMCPDERHCNYERYRILAQNDFLGISEDKYLHQLHLEEQFGINAQQPEIIEKQQKKPKTGGVAIGYTYDDSSNSADPMPSFAQQQQQQQQQPVNQPGIMGTAPDDSDSDLDVDVAIDISKIDTAQAHELNGCGRHYGMKSNDFYSFLTKDSDEADALKIAREEEQEKIMLSGRKSRRERRAQRERRFAGRPISPPSYAAKEEPTFKEEEKLDSNESRSPSPENSGKITYITSFGGDDELQPHSKISINFNKSQNACQLQGPAASIDDSIISGQSISYADKVKQNLDKLQKLNNTAVKSTSSSSESPRKPLAYRRSYSSRSRSRSRTKRSSYHSRNSRSSHRHRSRSSRSRSRRNPRRRSRSRSRSKVRHRRRSSRSRSTSSRRYGDGNGNRRSHSKRKRRYTSSSSSTSSSTSSRTSSSSSSTSRKRLRRQRTSTSRSRSKSNEKKFRPLLDERTQRSQDRTVGVSISTVLPAPMTVPAVITVNTSVPPPPILPLHQQQQLLPVALQSIGLQPLMSIPTPDFILRQQQQQQNQKPFYEQQPPPPLHHPLPPQLQQLLQPQLITIKEEPKATITIKEEPKIPEPQVPIKKYYGRKRDDQSSSSEDDLDLNELNETATKDGTSSDRQNVPGGGSSSSNTKFGKQQTTITSDTKNFTTSLGVAGKIPSKTSSSSTSALSSFNPRDRLKRKMQILLNKQYKADKLAEIEKTERQVQQQQEREDEMRELALRLRKRQRELRHKYGTPTSSQSDNSNDPESDSESIKHSSSSPTNGSSMGKRHDSHHHHHQNKSSSVHYKRSRTRSRSRSRSKSYTSRTNKSQTFTNSSSSSYRKRSSRDRSHDRGGGSGRDRDRRRSSRRTRSRSRSRDVDRDRYRRRNSRSRDRDGSRSYADRRSGDSRRYDRTSGTSGGNNNGGGGGGGGGGGSNSNDNNSNSRNSRKLVDY